MNHLALLHFLFAAMLLLAACAGQTPSEPTSTAIADTVAFQCPDGYRFTIHTKGEQVRLTLPDTTLLLPHVASASGAKYSDGTATFWSKGEEALLEREGRTSLHCLVDSVATPWKLARLEGADFRAVGQEPGWYLDIADGDSIVFVSDYGRTRTVTPAPEPEIGAQAGRTTYRVETEAHDLTVVLEDEPCQDTMSGEAFETTVTVTLDGEPFHGCGRALR